MAGLTKEEAWVLSGDAANNEIILVFSHLIPP
jgi:hypothetical protein